MGREKMREAEGEIQTADSLGWTEHGGSVTEEGETRSLETVGAEPAT